MLSDIQNPSDVKQLDFDQLQQLADEIREFLIESINKTGGHLGSNLGTIELTLALHYVFNTPEDSFVWDVGHQAYAHKILTGRKEMMSTLRQKDGLSGFTKRSESEHDAFGAGHSSTSISAALGFALANKINQKDNTAIAIIGDGALTGGMAFEAMNHAGDADADLLIVLNDNDMSISKNVGALNKYLTRLISGKVYSTMKSTSLNLLKGLPRLQEFAKRSEEHLKGMILPGTLFEELGIDYFGPIDGHDLPTLIKTLQNLKSQSKPRLLHIITTKGRGLEMAEKDPIKFHGIAPPSSSSNSFPSYSQVFGRWLCDTAANSDRLIAITPAMCEGSGMVDFAKQYPDRFFDVAIAEQHSVTVAAGMACEGLKPVVAIYSTFLQRAYDQLIHDVAIQNLDVTFGIDRAGLVGEDGPTHAGSFDLTYLRCVPNLIIAAPSDENECRQLLFTAYQHPGPAAVRYPRGTGPGTPIEQNMIALPIGKGLVKREGKRVAILAFGTLLGTAMKAAENLNASVCDMRFVKPIDEALIASMASQHDLIVTIEENAIQGGAGAAVSEYMAQAGIVMPVLMLGLPDTFIDHGTHGSMLAEAGLDQASIEASISQRLALLDEGTARATL